MGSVEQVHDLVSSMAKDNQVQSATISEITVAVGTMDTSTQQNAAMVEQTSAATRNLASEVALLSENAARFKTGQVVKLKPRTIAPVPVAAAAEPISIAPIAAPVAASGTFDDDDWADF
jgi:methyl-accepting chemotaxis protein